MLETEQQDRDKDKEQLKQSERTTEANRKELEETKTELEQSIDLITTVVHDSRTENGNSGQSQEEH